MSLDEAADPETEIAVPGAPLHDPYAVLRMPNFRLYLAGNALAIFGVQMQTVAVGWEIYERTHEPLDLGLVGLVQFLPIGLLTLPAGQVADLLNRKRIIMASMLVLACCSLGLSWISAHQGAVVWMYACLLASGVARAFLQPAKSSFLPQIVPREQFATAVTWNMGAFHLAAVVGPAAGGFLIAWLKRATEVYLLDAAATLSFFVMLAFIQSARHAPAREAVRWRTLLAGAEFVWSNKIILGAMTLDMFAVLLGGAVALLPAYAKDILEVGPTGLGWMQAAPAIGALLMSFVLAHRPPIERAGPAMLWTVAGFGAATIVFGFSRSFTLSLAMLFLTGAFDTVSVVIRHTLVQLLTPDEMRGRVSAINGMFIGASNELGRFESGLVAKLFGSAAFSVVSGGIGTLLVVAAVATLWPQLGRYGRLDGKASEEA
ncbi:MAG TPA: MFS transporter [Pirellulales bacterium]|jgi:MFS family permease|nr:MFS transporter [Pirellulales bacterium]